MRMIKKILLVSGLCVASPLLQAQVAAPNTAAKPSLNAADAATIAAATATALAASQAATQAASQPSLQANTQAAIPAAGKSKTPLGTAVAAKPPPTPVTDKTTNAAKVPDKPAEPAAKPAVAATPEKAAAEPAKTAEAAPAPPEKAVGAIKIAKGPQPCPVSEFRALGMETGDPLKRRSSALEWLAKKGKQCSAEKLVAIRNNRSQWMGSADSTTVAAAVDSLLEANAEGNPQILNLLYGTVQPPPKAPDEKKPGAKK